jgi:hypothetical protein
LPKGPQGQKRPADVTQNAVLVMKIATGEAKEIQPADKKTVRAAAGKKGGTARAAKMDGERRTEIAKKAAKTRWSKD